jgi:hypothetical protein
MRVTLSNHQPLAEVFGFPVDNVSPVAVRHRANRLCPYNNRVPNCTKDKANDPLGVCSIFDAEGQITVTCPVRFRQDWLLTEDAARFFFPGSAAWTSLAEVRINDRYGISAGNIDHVLISYDAEGRVVDFGALEVQAVYISGNVRRPFVDFVTDPARYLSRDWSRPANRPRPDYLSSSRKRLVPQLLYKGAILRSWGKRQAVALHRSFFMTLPALDPVEPEAADIAWLVYDLAYNHGEQRLELTLQETVYTRFKPALDRITTPEPGPVDDFVDTLQHKLDDLQGDEANPPDAPLLNDLL